MTGGTQLRPYVADDRMTLNSESDVMCRMKIVKIVDREVVTVRRSSQAARAEAQICLDAGRVARVARVALMHVFDHLSSLAPRATCHLPHRTAGPKLTASHLASCLRAACQMQPCSRPPGRQPNYMYVWSFGLPKKEVGLEMNN